MFQIDYLKKICSLQHPSNRSRLIGSDGQVSSVRDLFIGTNYVFTYVGVDTHRGIITDKWTTTQNQQFPNGGSVQVTIEYWFSVPEWQIFGFTNIQTPVRSRLVGTFTNSQGQTFPFENDYNFISFISGMSDHQRGESTYYIPHYCPTSFDSVPLPTLPLEYHTVVSVTNERNRTTYSFSEYVSHIYKSIRVDVRLNSTYVSYMNDHLRNITYYIDHVDNFCRQVPFDSRPTGNMRIFSPSQLYRWSQRFQFIYMGKERVREILCDKWSTTYVENGVTMNYTLTWYFASPEWSMYGNPTHNIPIRALFSGSVHNTIDHIDNFEYLWDFSQFISGLNAVVSVNFAVPKHCLVEIAPIPLPSIPHTFFAISETSLPLYKIAFSFQEWYDSVNDRAKFEYHAGGIRNLTIIDGKSRTIIQRNQSPGLTDCRTFTVDNTSRFIDQQGHIRSIENILQFSPQYGVKYTGKEWVRGIHCDHWFSNFTGTLFGIQNAFWTHEVYFSDPSWTNGGSNTQVPVRTITQGYSILPNGRVNHIPSYHRVVDYLGFFAGTFSDYEFSAPYGCVGFNAQNDVNLFGIGRDVSVGTYTGVGVSFTIIGLFVGLLGGLLFGYYASKSFLPPQGNL